MTTRTELLEIIASGENSGVEFKRDDLRTQDLAKELVAFSNLQGGMVLLGVEDDGTITGLTRDDLEEWVMSVCRDKVRPAIVPFFEVVRGVKDNHDVAIIRVTRGYDVHALWHNNTNRYLMRVGTQRSRSKPRGTRTSVSAKRFGTGRAPARIGRYAPEPGPEAPAKLFRRYPPAGCARRAKMRKRGNHFSLNTELMTEEGVTVGGMLLFAKTPNRFLPHAGIDAVAYPGTEQDYDAQERTALRGPMTPLLSQDGDVVENGLVEQALDFVQRNTRVVVEARGGRRLERPVYPRDALREGIVNALIHRDYLLTSTDVELAVYSNRLEIVSPGRLPNGITPERMRFGTRSARNQLLKDVMRDYRYLEHMGMGIPRKIIRGMREHNGTEPDLVELDERFIIRLLAQAPE